MQLREAILQACRKYGYSYQVDENGHVNMQGGKQKYRNNLIADNKDSATNT